MAARIANGQWQVKPRLVRPANETEAPAMKPLGVSPFAINTVTQGMTNVVNNPRGTAYAARIKTVGFEMAGKTGSAQVRRISMRERETGVKKQEERPWEERDHALFVAHAPLVNPRYACAVIVEHGGSGSKMAGPIARDILEEAQRRDPARKTPFRPRVAGAPDDAPPVAVGRRGRG
jgi:penicillin-binding protein 2